MMNQVLLYNHDDAITSISASKAFPNRFITTSLDGGVKFYDIFTNQMLQEFQTKPILDSISTGSDFYVSCVDGTVRRLDFETSQLICVGQLHSNGLNCISSSSNTIISGSWDKTLQLIDLQTGDSQFISLPEKVLSMDCDEDHLVVSMANRLIHVYKLDNLSTPFQIRESGLAYQIRSISCFTQGFALSSIEGKVSLEYYDNSNNYAFRCHRNKDIVNSVNCCLVSQDRFLYTAGDDGNMMLWDFILKKKLKTWSIGKEQRISKFLLFENNTAIIVSDNKVYRKLTN